MKIYYTDVFYSSTDTPAWSCTIHYSKHKTTITCLSTNQESLPVTTEVKYNLRTICIHLSLFYISINPPIYLLTHLFQYITHVCFYKIMTNTYKSMLIQMHLITLFRVMNPHQRCLQAEKSKTELSQNR